MRGWVGLCRLLCDVCGMCARSPAPQQRKYSCHSTQPPKRATQRHAHLTENEQDVGQGHGGVRLHAGVPANGPRAHAHAGGGGAAGGGGDRHGQRGGAAAARDGGSEEGRERGRARGPCWCCWGGRASALQRPLVRIRGIWRLRRSNVVLWDACFVCLHPPWELDLNPPVWSTHTRART